MTLFLASLLPRQALSLLEHCTEPLTPLPAAKWKLIQFLCGYSNSLFLKTFLTAANMNRP